MNADTARTSAMSLAIRHGGQASRDGSQRDPPVTDDLIRFCLESTNGRWLMTSYDNKASVSQLPGGDRSRWIALVALCAGFLLIILDQTIVNVALPSIQNDLHFSQSSLAWVVNAYLIAFGGLLLLVGRLGDLIGRRRIFLVGLAVFTSASLVCGLADSQTVLIAARFVQGIGGAMTSAVILG